MRDRLRLVAAFVFVGSGLLGACSDDPAPGDFSDAGGTDGTAPGQDAGGTDGSRMDGGGDATTGDAGQDARADAGGDAAGDAGSDSGAAEAGADAGNDGGKDSGNDSGSDGGGDAGGDAGDSGTSPATFTSIYTTTLAARCGGCHVGQGANSGGLAMGTTQSSARTALVGVDSNCDGSKRVLAGDAANSLLWKKVNHSAPCGSNMPLGGAKIPQVEIDAIASWINAGALDN